MKDNHEIHEGHEKDGDERQKSGKTCCFDGIFVSFAHFVVCLVLRVMFGLWLLPLRTFKKGQQGS